MSILTDSFAVDVCLALAALVGLLYYYLTATYDYWERKGVPYVKPKLFFGNMINLILMRKHIFFIYQDIYNALAGESFGGFFESRKPVLMIRDPVLIEQILIKDFSNFADRDFAFIDLKRDPLAGNLFNLRGSVWRNLRNKLIPTFTAGKLKGMFDQICNCGDKLLNEIERITLSNEVREAKKLGALFTTEVIASCAFGLQYEADSSEGVELKRMFEKVFAPSVLRTLEIVLLIIFRPLAQILRLRQLPKDVSEYTLNLVKSTMEYRKKNTVHRNDFLQLMMNLQNQEASGKQMNWKTDLSEEDAHLNKLDIQEKEEDKGTKQKIITDECIAAQAFVFLSGGSETVANSIALTLFELAANPKVQTRLQEELDSVIAKHGGKLTFESLKDMTYLDMVIQEKNRIHTDAGILNRVCSNRYIIPGTNAIIEKGMRIMIPIHAIHNDPSIYPEPDKFIPERFEGNNYHTSGRYLPFGDGPRVCIAMRFVILELKVCIAKIMSKYSVTVEPRTKVPLQFKATSFIMHPVGGVWVRFHKRKNNIL